MKDMETERLHLIPGDQVVFYTPTTRFQVEVSAAVTLTVTAHEFVQPKAKRRWWFRG